jgi:ABC-type lipoprotein release transport system permease subunit
VVLGLIGSFAGSALAMWLMERLGPLDFFVYPSRYAKLKRRA